MQIHHRQTQLRRIRHNPGGILVSRSVFLDQGGSVRGHMARIRAGAPRVGSDHRRGGSDLRRLQRDRVHGSVDVPQGEQARREGELLEKGRQPRQGGDHRLSHAIDTSILSDLLELRKPSEGVRPRTFLHDVGRSRNHGRLGLSQQGGTRRKVAQEGEDPPGGREGADHCGLRVARGRGRLRRVPALSQPRPELSPPPARRPRRRSIGIPAEYRRSRGGTVRSQRFSVRFLLPSRRRV
mmetsp:Transcript_43724/g.133010  ORF Transcript_43724/g.133010 Transcript_43724/m.133010 type:complete len:238 (+) Transcript_43724:239-952(+)